MRASVITLGCKVNEYESQSMMSQLILAGYEICEGLVPADLYIVNTCAVTNIGERKSRQMLTKIKKLNPKAKIVVAGCASQNNPAQFLKDDNVIAVVGNFGKHNIIHYINCENRVLPELEHKKYIPFKKPTETKARQYIKIQDGCDYFCTYCLIPYLRGRSRSRALKDIISEIKSTKSNEIVLTGINMSDYRIKGELALKTLIKEVDKLNKRFRLSSLECNVLDDEMLDILINCKNFCPHFHLSLQSACNDTLKRMNRHYTIEEFIEITKKIKKKFIHPCLSTDLIVGFKGETDEEFEITFSNLKEIGFSYMHIFPYSVRSGTVASRMSGDVDKVKVKARENRLLALRDEFTTKFYNENENTTHTMLVEEHIDGYSVGYTDNYIYTYINTLLPIGNIVKVKLIKAHSQGMLGEIVKDN